MSYILARKTAPSKKYAARIVGDLLKEKGKRRQMFCRDENRLFLTWMDRDFKPKIHVGYERGHLLQGLPSHNVVSNECRVAPEALTEG